MSEHITQKSEFEKNSDLQQRLRDVLSMTLSAENINTYADAALEQVIELVEDTVDAYMYQPTFCYETFREREEAAFQYYGLGNINRILDHINDMAEKIRDLDAIIEKAHQTRSIITPPSIGHIPVGSGNGEMTEKSTIPRLKTLLFIASNGLGIDISSESKELKLTEGALSSEMVRKAPYYLVEMPTIERTVLVCDEEANATFIFNDTYMAQYGISSEDLKLLTKYDLDDLIAHDPRFGKKLKYYPDSYVAKLTYYLSDKWSGEDPLDVELPEATYLYPLAPEEYMVKDMIWRELGVSISTVKRAIEAQQIEPERFRDKRNRVLYFYSPDAVAQIRQYLETLGFFSGEPPEDYEYLDSLVERWSSVSPNSIRRAVDELELKGNIYRKKGIQPIKFYSPEEVIVIYNLLASKGLFVGKAPEGYLSITDITRHFNLKSISPIKKIINSLELEAIDYRVSNGSVPHYAPEDIEKIRVQLEQAGFFTEKVPEGYLHISDIPTKLKTTRSAVNQAVQLLRIKGELYRGKSNRPETFYSPDNIESIRLYLSENIRMQLEFAPEGYMNKNVLWQALDSSEVIVKRAIEELGLKGAFYRTAQRNRPIIHYSPKEIDDVRQWLEALKEGSSVVGGDGWKTAHGIAKELGFDITTIQTAVEQLAIQREKSSLKATGRAHVHYTQEDQQAIVNYLREQGYYTDIAPEGFMNRANMESELGLSYKEIRLAIKNTNAESVIYRSHSNKRPERYYSPDAVAEIKQEVERIRAQRLAKVALR